MTDQLLYDPYNLIITGVGGQGNVMASRVVGNMLVMNGYSVTIGETFGVSQRGGSVMSHLRISRKGTHSPQIAGGQAHLVVALEPTEAIRVLSRYGNKNIKVICNTRPIYSAGVISGDQNYPELNQLKTWIDDLSAEAWYLNATDLAMQQIKNPIFSNIILIGALAASKTLPLTREDFQTVISQNMSEDKVATNMKAFDMGADLLDP